MTRLNSSKINQLVKHVPKEGIITTVWLKQKGISEKLAWWYVQSGWLTHLYQGAYHLQGQTIMPLSPVAALQSQLKRKVHIGGKTALQLLGFAHYLGLNLTQVELFDAVQTRLPAWVNHVKQTATVYTLTSAKLFNEAKIADTLVQRKFDGVEVTLSCPERALMEVLYHVQAHEEFQEAFLLMENITQARADIVQRLLENCCSIKVKRLFLYLAKKCGYAWAAQLKTDHIALGRGKRVIAGGGVYDSQYQLAVPALNEHDPNLKELIA